MFISSSWVIKRDACSGVKPALLSQLWEWMSSQRVDGLYLSLCSPLVEGFMGVCISS